MRFEVEKVVAHLQALKHLDDQDPASAQRAIATELSRRLESAGLVVDQLEAPPVRSSSGLTSLPFAILALLITAQSLLVHWGLRYALLYTTIAECAVIWSIPRLTTLLANRERERLPIVVARQCSKVPRQIRLVLATPLLRSHWLLPGIMEALFNSFMLLSVLSGVILNLRDKILHHVSGPVMAPVFFIWTCIALQLLVNRIFLINGDWKDTRAGVALLAELARTWPSSSYEAMEISFVAFGVNSTGEIPTDSALDWAIGAEAHAGPLLYVVLEDIGQGSRIEISGTEPPRGLALKAAKDLWLPHQDRPLPQMTPHRSRRAAQSLFLLGEQSSWWRWLLRKGPTDRELSPALLSATAQLITEVALRWARQQSETQGASAPKSSQKPG